MRPLTCYLLLIALATVEGVAAQQSPHARLPEEGDDFCGQLFLRADGRMFGHELVEFIHTPSIEGRPVEAPEAEVGPFLRADRAALWWRMGADSLGAYMEGEGETVWELRLGLGEAMLEGTLRRVVPEAEPSEVARAYTMVSACARNGGGTPR